MTSGCDGRDHIWRSPWPWNRCPGSQGLEGRREACPRTDTALRPQVLIASPLMRPLTTGSIAAGCAMLVPARPAAAHLFGGRPPDTARTTATKVVPHVRSCEFTDRRVSSRHHRSLVRRSGPRGPGARRCDRSVPDYQVRARSFLRARRAQHRPETTADAQTTAASG